MKDHSPVSIYAHGIASPAGGAFGALLICDGQCKEISGGEAGASNNRADLLAAVAGLQALKRPCKVLLYNANSYLIDAMCKGWLQRWQNAGWTTAEGKPIAHRDQWERLLQLGRIHSVEYVWIPTAGIAEFARCKRIARKILREQVRHIVEGRAKS